MDEAPPKPFVQCCACSRPIVLPADGGAGSELACIFCGARQRVCELTVLVTEALEA